MSASLGRRGPRELPNAKEWDYPAMKTLLSRGRLLTVVSKVVFALGALGMVACRIGQRYAVAPVWLGTLEGVFVGVTMLALSGVLIGEASAAPLPRSQPGRIINTVLAVIVLAAGLVVLAGVVAGLAK